MKLNFQHRQYPGNNQRPTPEVHLESSLNTLIIAAPWGPRPAARKVIDRVLEYLTFASQDREATSPLPKLSCLSPAANRLRIATMLANEMLFREDNREEYRVGVELLILTLSENELSWAQVGGPHLLLARGTSTLLPIGSTIDLSLDLSTPLNELPALPSQLLGLDSTVNASINSFRARPGDQLLLMSHSRTPSLLFNWRGVDLRMESMVRELAMHQADRAFWLGQLQIESDSSTDSTLITPLSGEVAS